MDPNSWHSPRSLIFCPNHHFQNNTAGLRRTRIKCSTQACEYSKIELEKWPCAHRCLEGNLIIPGVYGVRCAVQSCNSCTQQRERKDWNANQPRAVINTTTTFIEKWLSYLLSGGRSGSAGSPAVISAVQTSAVKSIESMITNFSESYKDLLNYIEMILPKFDLYISSKWESTKTKPLQSGAVIFLKNTHKFFTDNHFDTQSPQNYLDQLQVLIEQLEVGIMGLYAQYAHDLGLSEQLQNFRNQFGIYGNVTIAECNVIYSHASANDLPICVIDSEDQIPRKGKLITSESVNTIVLNKYPDTAEIVKDTKNNNSRGLQLSQRVRTMIKENITKSKVLQTLFKKLNDLRNAAYKLLQTINQEKDFFTLSKEKWRYARAFTAITQGTLHTVSVTTQIGVMLAVFADMHRVATGDTDPFAMAMPPLSTLQAGLVAALTIIVTFGAIRRESNLAEAIAHAHRVGDKNPVIDRLREATQNSLRDFALRGRRGEQQPLLGRSSGASINNGSAFDAQLENGTFASEAGSARSSCNLNEFLRILHNISLVCSMLFRSLSAATAVSYVYGILQIIEHEDTQYKNYSEPSRYILMVLAFFGVVILDFMLYGFRIPPELLSKSKVALMRLYTFIQAALVLIPAGIAGFARMYIRHWQLENENNHADAEEIMKKGVIYIILLTIGIWGQSNTNYNLLRWLRDGCLTPANSPEILFKYPRVAAWLRTAITLAGFVGSAIAPVTEFATYVLYRQQAQEQSDDDGGGLADVPNPFNPESIYGVFFPAYPEQSLESAGGIALVTVLFLLMLLAGYWLHEPMFRY
jgi:hypothetical protein